MEPAIYREKEVRSLLGVGKVTLWRWRKAGQFPAPIKLGPNSVAWLREEVHRWLETRPRAGAA